MFHFQQSGENLTGAPIYAHHFKCGRAKLIMLPAGGLFFTGNFLCTAGTAAEAPGARETIRERPAARVRIPGLVFYNGKPS